MIAVSELHKRFANVHAVAGVSFTARDGQVTGLLGPNGAGKTTTMRVVSTILKPDAGTVRIDDCDVAHDPMRARTKLGVVPHPSGLYPRLTAREHLQYFADLQGVPKKQAADRAEKLLDALHMRGIADRRTGGFSQGERLKVAIARALIHEPQNVLLDEPTNGLDIVATRAVRDIIRGFRRDGRCVVLSTHIMQEVVALCDHVVVIAKGRVIAEGTLDALRARTGESNLEEAFVRLIGSDEGLV